MSKLQRIRERKLRSRILAVESYRRLKDFVNEQLDVFMADSIFFKSEPEVSKFVADFGLKVDVILKNYNDGKSNTNPYGIRDAENEVKNHLNSIRRIITELYATFIGDRDIKNNWLLINQLIKDALNKVSQILILNEPHGLKG